VNSGERAGKRGTFFSLEHKLAQGEGRRAGRRELAGAAEHVAGQAGRLEARPGRRRQRQVAASRRRQPAAATSLVLEWELTRALF